MAVDQIQARVDRPRIERDEDEAPRIEKEQAPAVDTRQELERERNTDRLETTGNEEKRKEAAACPKEPGRDLGTMESAEFQSCEKTSWDTDPKTSEDPGELDPSKIGAAFGDQRPPQMIWTDYAVEIENKVGREQGGLSAEQEQKNKDVASALEGNTEKLEAGDMAILAREAGVPLEKQDPSQLVAATNYVNRATRPEDQQARIEKALNNFSILNTIGTPKLNEGDFTNVMWNAARIPGHAIDGFDAAKKDKTFQDVAAAMNNPGKSEFKIDNYNVKIESNAKNELVDSSTKKKSVWGTVGKIALNVGLGVAAAFTGGATLIAARVIASSIGIINGIKNKSVLGTIAGAAGAFGAVALGAGASAASSVASGIARGARAIQGGISAIRGKSAAGILGAVADGASAATGFIARGAENLQHNFDSVARWANRGSYAAGVGEGIKSGNAFRAVGDGLNLVGSGVGVSGENAARFGRVGRAVAGVQGDALSVAAAATGFAAGISNREDLGEVARLTDAINNAERARKSGDSGLLAEAMVGLGEQARSTRQYLSRAQTVIQIPNRSQASENEDASKEEELALLESHPIAGLDQLMLSDMPVVEPNPIEPWSTPYSVKRGDTIEALAAKNGLTTQELLDANGLDQDSARRLQIGSTLEIPLETNDARGAENLRRYREQAAAAAAAAAASPAAGCKITGPNIDPPDVLQRNLVASEGFQWLNPTLRVQAVVAVGLKPELAQDVTALINSRAYNNLNDSMKLELLDAMTDVDTSSRSALLELARTPGLATMSDREKMRLTQLVDGTNSDVSAPERNALAQLIAKPEFKTASPTQQAQQLQKFLREQPGLPGVVGDLDNIKQPAPGSYKLRAIPTAPSKGGQDFTLDIDGQQIMISMPATYPKGMSAPTAKELAEGLAAIPESSRKLINGVVVLPTPREKVFMAAGASNTVFVYPGKDAPGAKYTRETFVHEAGHFLSMESWGREDNDPRWKTWLQAMANDGVSVSRYAIDGERRQMEDFAETWTLYTKARGTRTEPELRELFGARFREIDALLAAKNAHR